MSFIVSDERRENRPKGARPEGVALGSPLGVVALLVRAPSPPCTARLASELPKAITTMQANAIMV